MDTSHALLSSAVILGLILVSTIIVALIATPIRGHPSPSLATPSTTSISQNVTSLTISIRFPNGTSLVSADIAIAGVDGVEIRRGVYSFSNVRPGIYSVNFSGPPNVFFPPTQIKVQAGLNLLNLTVYRLEYFRLYQSTSPGYNGTSPGPPISVVNGTAVEFLIFNNSTLIRNFAIVRELYNTSSNNILFDSLSSTLNGGGSANDTFIVTSPGFFYYEDMIGSHARDGDYGYFVVR